MSLCRKKNVLINSIFCIIIYFLAVISAVAKVSKVNTSHKNMTLNGRLLIVEKKSLNAQMFLILHGTLGHYEMEIIHGLQEALEERSFNSLAINLSYGQNSRPGKMFDCNEPHRHKHEDAIGEIEAWLDWLKSAGVKNVILAGHSRGGNQIARFAAENQHELVSKIVLIAPTIWSESQSAKSYKKFHSVDLKDIIYRAEQAVVSSNNATMLKNVGILYCRNTQASPESLLSYYIPDNRFDTVTLFDKIGVPLLLVTGSEDKISPNLDQKVEPMLENGKVMHVAVEGADHFFRDLFLEDVADAMIELAIQKK